MTNPTKEQLAPSINPLIREYVDAVINDAVSELKSSIELRMASSFHAENAAKVALEEVRRECTEAVASMSEQIASISFEIRQANLKERGELRAEIRGLKEAQQ